MSKPIVLVDMDEVIVALLDEWLESYGFVAGGVPCNRKEFTSYSFDGQFENMQKWWDCIDKGDVLMLAKPMELALNALDHLTDFTDVYIVTYARTESNGLAHQQKLRWLEMHAPWFDRDKVIFTKHKHLVAGHYLIEDSIDNIRAWLANLPHGIAFLVEAPWNRDVQLPRGCRRVRSLTHAMQLIRIAEGTHE